MGTSVWASPASEAIQALTTHGSYTREVRLSALGVVEPVALLKESASRDFYFPMPRSNVTDARIHFSGRTHKTEEGRTGVILSVNGIPQYTQTVAEGDAALAVDLSVAPRAQPDGFARLGVQWQTLTTVNYCQLERDTGNVLTISPDSRLVFRHGLSNLSVDEAWRLLPPQPVLLVGSTKLAQDAYDTAWRLGTALTRAGKAPRVAALPDVGSNVTLGEVSVPAALAGVPAFAGLRSGSGLKIEDAAQLAALMLSGGGAIRGDVLVVDAELRKRVGDAIAALSQQMSGDTQAQAALAAWGDQLLATAGADGAKGAAGVRTAALGGQPTLAVSTGGAGVVGALDSVWRQVLQGPTAQVQSAKTVDPQRQNTFSLASLGAGGGSIDVVAKGEWSGSFPLAAVLGGGRVPKQLVLNVVAAPSPSTTPPILSVYWDDTMLGSTQLKAEGAPESLTLQVPSHVLGMRNVLRAVFQRQPLSHNCDEIPQGFPVQVLPTSHIVTGPGRADASFVGLLPDMTDRATLVVPQRYLEDAVGSLPAVIRTAFASGMSPGSAELMVAAGDAPVQPNQAFLSMEVPVQGASSSTSVGPNCHLRVRNKEIDWVDMSGLDRLSVAEVVGAQGGRQGILWQRLGEASDAADARPYLLSRGDVALVGREGVLAWLDTRGTAPNASEGAAESGTAGSVAAWWHSQPDAVRYTLLAVLGLIVLLLLARLLRRR